MAPVPRPWLPPYAGLMILVGGALALHAPIYGDGLNYDASVALEVAHSISHDGSLSPGTSLAPHHPPGLPLVYLPFCLALGFTEVAVHTCELFFLGVDIVILYLLSRQLGPQVALVPGLLLALDPVVYINMSEGRAVAPLILWSLLTLWGIWKGLRDSRWLLAAAAAASMGFLTADQVGYLFLVGGLVGLGWRFYYGRWALFRDRGYLAAMGLFSAVVGGWAGFSLATTGSAFTDPRAVGFLDRFLFATPLHVAAFTIGGSLVLFSLYMVQSALPFLLWREGRRALALLPHRAVVDQKLGALVLFPAVVLGISALMASSFVLYEPLRSVANFDTYLRYVAIAAPFTFLAVGLQVASVAQGSSWMRWALPLACAALLLSAQLVPRIAQGDANGAAVEALAQEMKARGYDIVYSEGAVALRYNCPSTVFVSIDKGVSTPFVNITNDDVPQGAHMVTSTYVPRTFDKQIGNLFLIDHFDPALHSPFRNLQYDAR